MESSAPERGRPGADDRRWRRQVAGRTGIAMAFAVMDLALVALAGIGWANRPLLKVVGPTVMGLTAAVGVLVLALVASASASALRADRIGRPLPPADRRASAGVLLAFARLLALITAVVVITAVTEPAADGRWQLDWAFLLFAFVDALIGILVALLTKGAISRRVGR